MKLLFVAFLALFAIALAKPVEYPYAMKKGSIDLTTTANMYDLDFLATFEDDVMKVADILASTFPDLLTSNWEGYVGYQEIHNLIENNVWSSVTVKYNNNILYLYAAVMDFVCSTQVIALAQDAPYTLHGNLYNTLNFDKANFGVDLSIPHDTFEHLFVDWTVTYRTQPSANPTVGRAIGIVGLPGFYMASTNESTFTVASISSDLESLYDNGGVYYALDTIRSGKENDIVVGTYWLRDMMFNKIGNPCTDLDGIAIVAYEYLVACTFDDSTTSQIISTGTLTDGHSIADDGDAVAAVAGYSYSGAYSRDGCDDDSGKPCDAPPSYLTYDPLSFVFDNLEGRGSKKNTADYISNFIFRSYPVRYGQTVASVSM
ncbi:hypothetical protein ADUPG1_007431, partial [Aduncisulcus paluster]